MYKGMYNKVTVGGPEEILGTPVARTDRLQITSFTNVMEKATKTADEVISGRGTNRRNIINAIDVTMEAKMQLHATKGIGKLFMSAIGQDLAAPIQVGAAVVLVYTGDQASCKIVVTNTEGVKTVASSIGSLGGEAPDSSFGTAGVLDLSAASFDTVAELVSAIEGYADYSCEKLFGPDSFATTDPVAIAASQAAGNSVILYFVSANSGAYLHRMTPVLTATERPTLSLQADGTGSTFDVMSGAVVDSLEISADLKGRVALTASLIGTLRGPGTETSVALPSNSPLKFSGAKAFFAGVSTPFMKNMALTISNNHDSDEGFGMGSLRKIDHAKGKFTVSGKNTVRTSIATESEFAKRIEQKTSSILAIFQGDNLATNIPEMVAVSIPHVDIMDASKSSSDVSIDTEFTWEAVDPASYDAVLTVDMITIDSAKYN